MSCSQGVRSDVIYAGAKQSLVSPAPPKGQDNIPRPPATSGQCYCWPSPCECKDRSMNDSAMKLQQDNFTSVARAPGLLDKPEARPPWNPPTKSALDGVWVSYSRGDYSNEVDAIYDNELDALRFAVDHYSPSHVKFVKFGEIELND